MSRRWYGKDKLPHDDQFNQMEPSVWRKQTTTLMWGPTIGPLDVYTKEGMLQLSHEWEGYIALDSEGFPYPIDLDVHKKTYEEIMDDDKYENKQYRESLAEFHRSNQKEEEQL